MTRSTPGPRRRNPRMLALWLSLLCVFIAELLVYTWVRVQCVRVGYEISTLNKEQQRLNELQANLKVELARLKAPQRITKIAQERLGLTLPAPRQMMVMP
ncbi:MAG: cell division protein FtsL [Hyphomicrobiales bacterium]